MKKSFLRLLTVLVAVLIFFSVTPITFAYDNETKIIYSDSFDEYSYETSKTVIETENMTNYDEDKALENDYYTFRALVYAKNIRSINFARFNPLKVLFDETGEIAILTFANAKDTKYAVDKLNDLDCVEFAEADSIVEIPEKDETPNFIEEIENNARASYSWGVTALGCDKYSKYLHDAGFDKGIVVAVIDTGIDYNHPYFQDRIMSNGHDYVSNNNYPQDQNGHGTHVAGTILDCTGDLLVGILPVRVLGADGKGSTSNIANGIKYASDKGAQVLNLSLGGGHSLFIDLYINNAYKSGKVICVAAGNESENCSESCPAHVANAITVSAVDQNFQFATFSNYGSGIDICAPGVNITSTYLNGTYATLDGTSMATPHISAVCAMIKLNYPDFSPSAVMTALEYCATDLGNPGFDALYGNGIPNLDILFNLHTHSAGDWETVNPATCVNNGIKVKLCKYCGELMDTGVIESVGEHIFGEWKTVTAPNCQNTGLKSRQCLYCTETQTQVLEKSNHDYTETVVDKTCTSDGYTLHQCKNCPYSYTSDIVPASHEFKDTVVLAKCTEQGYTHHQCQKCDYNFDDNFTEALTHIPGEWVTITPASVENEGLEGQYCSRCKQLVNSRTVPKINVVIEGAKDSGVVVDKENKLIYGIPSEYKSIEDLLCFENCTLDIHQTENRFGSGTIVDILVGGVVYDTYEILVYGDLTGDGIADESDIIIINLYVSWNLQNTEEFEQSISFLAADLTKDGVVDESDLIVLFMANAWLCTIDQVNPANSK